MNWPSVPIGEIAYQLRNGKSVKQMPGAGGLPITRIETISSGSIDLSRCGYADLAEDECKGWILRDGDILISHINSMKHLGKCAIFENISTKVVHGMNLLCLRVNQDIAHPKFIFHSLRSRRFISQISTIAKKSVNQASFNISTFQDLEIPLPPLDEQRRIAAILDKAENLRLLAHLSSRTLASYKESVFLDMFGSPTQSFSPWPVLPLGEAARLENGDRSANYPSGHDIKEDGVLFLSTKNIVNNKLDLSKSAFITTNKFNSLTQGKARPGDLVITLRGTLGSCCIFSCSHETAFINAQMMLIRPHESLLPIYLHALLTTSAFQSKLQSLGYGAAVRQLSSSQLSSLLIPVPPISMQLEFARRLDRALEVISSCDLRYEKINKLLHSIRMPAFSAIRSA